MKVNLEGLREVCSRHRLVALFFHGSRATGKARPDSDYDFALLGRHGCSTDRAVEELLSFFSRELEIDERFIDLQDLRQGTPYYTVRVVEDGELLFCSDPTELARFHAGSVSAHRDREYYLRPFREAMKQRIREGRFGS